MTLKIQRISFVFFFLSVFCSLNVQAADVRNGMYRQIEKLCNKNAAVKMNKTQIKKVCKCVVEEHRAKNLDYESVKGLYKIYSKSKTLKTTLSREDSNLLATYDADTAKDCLNKHKK